MQEDFQKNLIAFKNHKEGVVSHCFDTGTVKLHIVSADGGAVGSKEQRGKLFKRMGRSQGNRAMRQKPGAYRRIARFPLTHGIKLRIIFIQWCCVKVPSVWRGLRTCENFHEGKEKL